jgi:hypothetical protein
MSVVSGNVIPENEIREPETGRIEEFIIHRLRRYAVFSFQYVFQEKIRGLDFSMRDVKLESD